MIGVKKLWLIRPSVNTSNVSDKFKRYLSIFFNLSIFILIILFISFLVLFVFSIVTVFLFYRYLKRLILNIELNKPKKLITKFFVTLIKFGISFIFVFFAIYFLLDADKYFFGHKNLFSNYNSEKGKVDRVIDGDTIVLIDGRRIRYLAVDTPEKDDCFFKESTNRNKQLVDLGEIPDTICINITKQFESVAVGDRKRLLTYFINHRLKNLTESLSEF